MEFKDFKIAVAQQFDRMSKYPLFRTAATKDELWATYLGSFPEGTNPIFRERTEHDCQCCRQFIRSVGNVVAIIDGKVETIWDICLGSDPYQTVACALSNLVTSKPIVDVFLHYERTVGTDKSFEDTIDGVQTWNHFFVHLPEATFLRKDQIPTKLGELRANHDVLKRGLEEITDEAVDAVLELIAQNSLYRGQDHAFALGEFKKLKDTCTLDTSVWFESLKVPQSVSRIRNTSIGTLLVDLSKGTELEDAVKKFETNIVAPANYKRPTALVTKAMVDKAKKTVEELGLTSALERRYANLQDITINNVLFADRNVKKAWDKDAFDVIAAGIADKPDLSRVETVTIDQFLNHILPKAETVEVLMNNGHTGNLMSLITAADQTAKQLFKWDNQFSWTYNGDIADSMKEKVKAAGGSVVGDLCCRLAWEYEDDLDFHMFEPADGHVYFSNRRQLSRCGGMLDVDANGMDGIKEHPVENIFYADNQRMKTGVYKLAVNNYSRRSDGVGFEVEIEFDGTTHHFVYDRVVKNGETVTVAQIKWDGTKFEIIESLPSTTSVKEVWGIKTNTFQKVSAVMLSPNYWDGQGVGNKHYFFMLDGCKNDGKARGFYNEFLNSDLDPHRKVMEMVGTKMKTDGSEHQLSGLGFSSTQRNTLTCRITGSFTRIINIAF